MANPRFSPLAIQRSQTTHQLFQEVADHRAANPKRLEIVFPWPPKGVSPNAKNRHWRAVGNAKKEYKSTCTKECQAAGLHLKKHSIVADGFNLQISYTFNPPNKIRRDKDNCIASIKALQDAIATVVGVDDNHFVTTYSMGECGAGNVTVIIESAAIKRARVAA
jgi:hypothetical protein